MRGISRSSLSLLSTITSGKYFVLPQYFLVIDFVDQVPRERFDEMDYRCLTRQIESLIVLLFYMTFLLCSCRGFLLTRKSVSLQYIRMTMSGPPEGPEISYGQNNFGKGFGKH
jgi:hypothetical protein